MSFTGLLVDSITKAAAGVTPDMLTKVWESDYGHMPCIQRGTHLALANILHVKLYIQLGILKFTTSFHLHYFKNRSLLKSDDSF